MLKRVATAVVGIPLVILLMILGNPILQICAGIVALIGVYEFYHVMKLKYHPFTWIGYGITFIYFCNYNWWIENFILFIMGALMILMVTMVFTYPKYNIIDVAITLMAPLYVGVLLSFILLLRDHTYGVFLVWLVFISGWGSDTCAYFAGKLFGRHKLAPILSPKKTVEGAVGGAIGAACIAWIYTYIYTQFAFGELRAFMLPIIVIVFVSAIFSQIGDLAASAIKRMLEVKDFGYIFPGHGGVLDRFDSILFVAPTIVIALQILTSFNL